MHKLQAAQLQRALQWRYQIRRRIACRNTDVATMQEPAPKRTEAPTFLKFPVLCHLGLDAFVQGILRAYLTFLNRGAERWMP